IFLMRFILMTIIFKREDMGNINLKKTNAQVNILLSILLAIFFVMFITLTSIQAQTTNKIDPYVALEFNVGTSLGQMRMAPVGINGSHYMLLIYSEMRGIDPFEGSFHSPTSTIKLALYDFKGNQKWKQELPNGVPGTW